MHIVPDVLPSWVSSLPYWTMVCILFLMFYLHGCAVCHIGYGMHIVPDVLPSWVCSLPYWTWYAYCSRCFTFMGEQFAILDMVCILFLMFYLHGCAVCHIGHGVHIVPDVLPSWVSSLPYWTWYAYCSRCFTFMGEQFAILDMVCILFLMFYLHGCAVCHIGHGMHIVPDVLPSWVSSLPYWTWFAYCS